MLPCKPGALMAHLLIPLVWACSEPCLCFQICSHCRDNSRTHVEKVLACHHVHFPVQWWLRLEKKILLSLSTSFKGFELYLFSHLSHEYFFGIFLSENSQCVRAYSHELPYLVLARGFARGGCIFNQANWIGANPFLRSEKKGLSSI